jgi:hypothetical protein
MGVASRGNAARGSFETASAALADGEVVGDGFERRSHPPASSAMYRAKARSHVRRDPRTARISTNSISGDDFAEGSRSSAASCSEAERSSVFELGKVWVLNQLTKRCEQKRALRARHGRCLVTHLRGKRAREGVPS